MSRAAVYPLTVGTRLTLRAGTCLVVDGADLTLVDPGAMESSTAIDHALQQLGFGLDDITRVFYTHLHFDHYAGTVFGPRVREVVVPRAEYDFVGRLMALRYDPEAYSTLLRANHDYIAPVFLRQFARLATDPRYDFERPELQDRLHLMVPGERVGTTMISVDLSGHCPGQLGLHGLTQYGDTLIAGDAVLSLEDWTAPDLTHLLIVWKRGRLLESRRRCAGVHCLIPSHGPWFRPADRTLIVGDGE